MLYSILCCTISFFVVCQLSPEEVFASGIHSKTYGLSMVKNVRVFQITPYIKDVFFILNSLNSSIVEREWKGWIKSEFLARGQDGNRSLFKSRSVKSVLQWFFVDTNKTAAFEIMGWSLPMVFYDKWNAAAVFIKKYSFTVFESRRYIGSELSLRGSMGDNDNCYSCHEHPECYYNQTKIKDVAGGIPTGIRYWFGDAVVGALFFCIAVCWCLTIFFACRDSWLTWLFCIIAGCFFVDIGLFLKPTINYLWSIYILL